MVSHYIVQISDFHIREENPDFLSRIETMANCVLTEMVSTCETAVFLIPGDLAYAGVETQFKAFNSGIETVKKCFSERNKTAYFIFAPGNHDCDFKTDKEGNEVRNEFLSQETFSNYSKKTPPGGVLKIFLKPQQAFFDFSKQHGFPLLQDNLVTQHEIESIKLRVTILNTAWASTNPEGDKLVFPNTLLESVNPRPGFLNITLYHHPDGWLELGSRKVFRDSVSRFSDFIITGHEHNSETFETNYMGGDSQVYFEGGAFWETGEESHFRILKIDMVSKTFDVCDFSWDNSERVFKREIYKDIVLPKNPSLNAMGIPLETDFKKFLDDPGIPLKHSEKSELKLWDVYVETRLIKEKSYLDESGPGIVLAEGEIISLLRKGDLNLLLGPDKSGKTSLFKKLFYRLYHNGKVPLYIHGSDIKSDSKVVLENLVKNQILRQYGPHITLEKLNDPNLTPVLLLDGFDKVELSPQKSGRALKYLQELLGTVLVSADSSIDIQLLDDPRFGVSVDQIQRFKIATLSDSQKTQLISKWLNIGAVDEIDVNTGKFRQIHLKISQAISEMGIPNYPLFVLTHLQVGDTARGLSLDLSSNTKLLEALVDISLSHIAHPNYSESTYISYLRELAFYFHVLEKRRISREEVSRFTDNLVNVTDSPIYLAMIIKDLVNSQILGMDEDGSVYFRYAHLRSYFIASYLSFKSSNPEVKERTRYLVKNIHMSENANILASLSLMSSDDWILKELTLQLNSCLEKMDVMGFEQLDKVVKEILDIQHFPEIQGMEYDTLESEGEGTEESVQEDEYEKVSENSQAVRYIKILGQLLRNSSNELTGDVKKEVIDAIFRASGRLVYWHSYAFSNGKDKILAHMYSKLRESKSGRTEAKDKQEAASKLAMILIGCSIGLIDTVSRSVGDEFLAPTFGKIEETDQDGLYSLYLLAVKMDWYQAFPKSHVVKLAHAYQDKKLSMLLLRNITFRGLVFRSSELGMPTIQEMCSHLKLKIENLRLATSKESDRSRLP